MCGITGWLSFRSSHAVSPGVLTEMRETMFHRGPDGAGLWISQDHRVGLAFRRLAIVDLSASANQPMSNEDGTVWVVFNGEIYNHAVLRRELESRGHRFRSDHSDTETIVHGYEEWGANIVQHLEGMFAFALWDSPERQLFLARDRVGIKPLYFAWIDSGFLFASEIKALLAHPRVTAALEPIAAYHYLSFMTTPAPLTMFKGIYKIPAGHHLRISAQGAFAAVRYWDALPGQTEDLKELQSVSPRVALEFASRRTRELLDAAVEKRMMSDVPFGVLLSGGIDSSTNVALMSRHLDRPVRTFTVGFSDHTHLNELQYARQVADRFGTDHREILIDEKAMRDYLPQLIVSQDEPIADWVCIPLYFVSKLVRDSGTIVVQVGEGSDEQFCGYDSYMAYLQMYARYWQPFSRFPGGAKRTAARIADWIAGLDDRHDAYIDTVIRAGRNREPFWSGATVFTESRKARLVDKSRLDPLIVPPELSATLLPPSYCEPDSFQIPHSFFSRLDREAPGSDFLTRMTYSEFKLRLPELLLMRVDKIGMSVSIEPRVPFLDHKLVEFTMNLPMEIKIAGGVSKAVLKQAVRGLLPDNIIDRPKMGFGAPMVQWLRGDFGKAVESEIASSRFFECFPASREEILHMLRRHRQGGSNFALYIWTFYNAVAWFDRWVDGIQKRKVA